MWYTQREQPFRFGLWTVLNGFLPVPFLIIYYGMPRSITSFNTVKMSNFSSLAGLGHVTTGPLVSWQLIFLLLGVLSCVTGFLLVGYRYFVYETWRHFLTKA